MIGRQLLRWAQQVPNLVIRKWLSELLGDFLLKWNTVLAKERRRKEVGLLWLVWHKAAPVNHWGGRIDNSINTSYPICSRRPKKTILHHFWECIAAQCTWQ